MEERIKDVLPNSCLFGENVSKHTNIDYSIGDMMASVGHRANLLDKRFEALGVGIARGKDDFLYFTLEFARLCEVRRVSRTLESLDNLAEQEDRSSNDDFSRRARDLARAGER